LTETTITDEGALRNEMETVRTRGVATDREEWCEDQRGLAAGIGDANGRAVGSVYVLIDAESMSGKQVQQDIPGLLISSANQIRQSI